MQKHPQSAEFFRQEMRDRPILSGLFWVGFELPIQIALVLVILGIFPDSLQRLYSFVLVVTLSECAFLLVRVLFAVQAR